MNRPVNLGRLRMDGWLILAAVLCVFVPSALAQAPSSSSTNAPGLTAQPQVAPPATAPVAAAPPTPSMMPNVPGTELDRVVAIVNDDLILDSDVNEELRLQAFDPYHTRSE